MSEASGHQGLWAEPRYPGDTVRIMELKRGDEIGDIRIQHYGENVRVGMFLPGRIIDNPGDTPKVEPERCEWFPNNFAADAKFDDYVQRAFENGWQRIYFTRRA